MIKIEQITTGGGIESVICGMRNPMNSWSKSDSGLCKGGYNGIGCENCAEHPCKHSYDGRFKLGKNDYKLMKNLATAGPSHRKYMRMMTVYMNITAPLYWWKEFDTYKVGTVTNSCSTMHKISSKKFVLDDFSHEHLLKSDDGRIEWGDYIPLNTLESIITGLNSFRERYIETGEKVYWWQLIQLLPSSYNQQRTVMLNYEVLHGIYRDRKHHKLDEWREFCDIMAKNLPYSDLFTM